MHMGGFSDTPTPAGNTALNHEPEAESLDACRLAWQWLAATHLPSDPTTIVSRGMRDESVLGALRLGKGRSGVEWGVGELHAPPRPLGALNYWPRGGISESLALRRPSLDCRLGESGRGGAAWAVWAAAGGDSDFLHASHSPATTHRVHAGPCRLSRRKGCKGKSITTPPDARPFWSPLRPIWAKAGGAKGSRYTSLMIYVCPIGQVRELLHHGDLHCMQQRRSAISVRLGALLHDLLRWDPIGIEVGRGKRGFAESCART